MGRHPSHRSSHGLVSLETSCGNITLRPFSNHASWLKAWGTIVGSVEEIRTILFFFEWGLCVAILVISFAGKDKSERPVVELWVKRPLPVTIAPSFRPCQQRPIRKLRPLSGGWSFLTAAVWVLFQENAADWAWILLCIDMPSQSVSLQTILCSVVYFTINKMLIEVLIFIWDIYFFMPLYWLFPWITANRGSTVGFSPWLWQ